MCDMCALKESEAGEALMNKLIQLIVNGCRGWVG